MAIADRISRRTRHLLATMATGAILLAGCAADAPSTPGPIVLGGSITVGDNLNPNLQGRPSPLQLRVYQLHDPVAFMSASFQDLALAETATLGATLVQRDSFELCPREMGREPLGGGAFCQGDRLPFQLNLQPKVRHIGVMAEFSDLLDPAGNWRAIVEVPREPDGTAPGASHLNITVQRATVSVHFD